MATLTGRQTSSSSGILPPPLRADQIRYTFMLRHGCEEDCVYCRIGNKRPTVYAARAFAQQYILMNKRLCPRIAQLYLPLVNFDRPRLAESLIMRVRCGKVSHVEAPITRPDIGIIVRPQHVAKHKPKVKEPIKEKPIVNAGSYQLRDLNMRAIERVGSPIMWLT